MDLNRFQSLDLVVICGLQGTGKTHFSKEYFGGSSRLRVNRNEIRRLLYEMMHFGEPWRPDLFNENEESVVKHTERKIIEHLLQTNQKVLVDNTSVTKDSRRRYLETARQFHKTAGIIFIQNTVLKCLERNHQSKTPVPDTVISNLSLKIELPSKDEGFQETLIIKDY